MRTLQRLLLREKQLAAFFADESGLSLGLLQETKGVLRGRHWDRLRLQRGLMQAPRQLRNDLPGAAPRSASAPLLQEFCCGDAAQAGLCGLLAWSCGSGSPWSSSAKQSYNKDGELRLPWHPWYFSNTLKLGDDASDRNWH
ncbi:hypothetical protein NDU88_009044 [Pleurodeles waltl]|uniref:Uncharacterized protein n=1 Tax=Pleurodeles waltl TaxID=8319 RepID=A0AAV7PS66_PLEWA|nr:hypothetical protein NDU88_009044 [Pleurodeles waltl]